MSRAVVSAMNRSDRSPGKGNRSTRRYACAFTLELPVGDCGTVPCRRRRACGLLPFGSFFEIAHTRCRPMRNATSRETGVTVSVEAVAAEPNYASRRSATPQPYRRVPSSRAIRPGVARRETHGLPCAARRRRPASGVSSSTCSWTRVPRVGVVRLLLRARDRRSPDGALERRGREDGVLAKEPGHGRTIMSRPRGFDVHAFRRLNSARRKTAYTIGIIARL